jgi:hypothetical protein
MCSMLMGYFHMKFQMPSTTGSLGITIKSTNKGWFQGHIVTAHTTKILL